jgi:hypothetical protein
MQETSMKQAASRPGRAPKVLDFLDKLLYPVCMCAALLQGHLTNLPTYIQKYFKWSGIN